MYNILAADGIAGEGIELLKKDFNVEVRDKLSAEELLEIIPKFDALIVRSASKVTAEVLNRAEKLKIIGRAGVGVDNIDVNAATERGIIVINSPDGNTIAATEHTFAIRWMPPNTTAMVMDVKAIAIIWGEKPKA